MIVLNGVSLARFSKNSLLKYFLESPFFCRDALSYGTDRSWPFADCVFGFRVAGLDLKHVCEQPQQQQQLGR